MTNGIIGHQGEITKNYVKEVAKVYSERRFTDRYLPSKDELNLFNT
jgi:hypothetical protein|tara:strand:- start:560 stop:697 length:138 start_codon:yes stop_codon:yes gene_type:complete